MNANDYLGKAEQFLDKGDFKNAIDNLTKALEQDPNLVTAYTYRGVARAATGNDKGAISDYTKAIEINPKSASSYVSRGLSRIKIGDKNGACSDWKKADELGWPNAKGLIQSYCF